MHACRRTRHVPFGPQADITSKSALHLFSPESSEPLGQRAGRFVRNAKTCTADNGGDADLGGPRNSAKAPSPSQ
jgi:hypothetical protein